MAPTPVQFKAPSGLTLTLELYPFGSDTIANGAGDSCTEATNNEGTYSADVTEALTGLHTARIVSGTATVASYDVVMADDTEIHWANDSVVVAETASTVTDGAKSATALSDATWTDAKAAFLDAGITTRAEADKMLAYFQVSLRKDEAIETDRATELGEINADEGSGVGDYAPDTNSNEAIRDHGDQAWVTGSGASADKSYTTTDWTRTIGDNDGGTGSDTLTVNGAYFATGEVAGSPYLQVDATFTAGTAEVVETLDVWAFYDGGGAHFINVEAKDVVSGLYEPIGVIGQGSSVTKHTFGLSPNNTDPADDTIDIRFIHGGGSGVPSHVFNIDKAQINSKVAASTLTAIEIWTYETRVLTASTNIMSGDNVLDVTAEGNAGIDWANIENPTETVDLSGTTTATTDGTVADAVWDEILTGATHNIPTSAGRRLREIASMVVWAGTAQGPGVNGNQIQLDTGASAVDGSYDPTMIAIVLGTGEGQSRQIFDYVGSTRMATVDRPWKVNPDATSEFVIYANPGREHVNEGLAQAGASMTITLNALASAADDAYNGQIVFIRSGTGDDQARWVTDYVGSTKVATVNRAWDVTPDSTSAYAMLPSGMENLSAAETGDEMKLEDASIKGPTYDGVGAFPVASVDSGATKIARTGADGDTLETLSDEIAEVKVVVDAIPTTPMRGTDGSNTTVPLEASVAQANSDAIQAAVDLLPTAAEIDTELTSSHGIGSWQTGSGGGGGGVAWAVRSPQL